MRFTRLLSSFTLCCAAYGCSLLNIPDDVVPNGSAGKPSGSSGASTQGGETNQGGDESGGGTVGKAGEGGAGNTGNGGEGGSEPVDPGPGPNPTTGLIVVGAKDDQNTRHLAVLVARTGAEITSEPLPVAAVAYDEAPDRHLWFVFTAGAFPAAPTGAADLEVRRFDDATDEWFVIEKYSALPPPVPDQLVVLNDRLAYLSHRVVGGKAVSSLTLLDTSDPSDITEITTQSAPTGESYVGLVGDRGSDVDAEATGGRLRLMIARDCAADCELVARQVFVGASLTDGTSLTVDRFVGQPRFAKGRIENRLYAALRSTTPSDRLVVRSYQGDALSNPTAFALTGFVGNDVGGLDLAECAAAGIVTDVDGQQLVAFNLTAGQLKTQALGHAGGPVYFEPFAPSALALDPASAPGMGSFEIAKSGASNVAINTRSIWKPTSTSSPYTGATRRREVATCP
jgi:hypothetical protein